MQTIFLLFIALQIILFLFITLHDWVHIPPFTDINELKKHHSATDRLVSTIINGSFVLFALILTLVYNPSIPSWAMGAITADYGALSLGTILAWWKPYFFGSSQEHKEGFAEYRNTHTFLPPRGDSQA